MPGVFNEPLTAEEVDQNHFRFVIGTMLPTDSHWHCEQAQVDPDFVRPCPECRQPFVLKNGYTFPTFWRTQEGNSLVTKFGFLAFCSPRCTLSWVNAEQECAKA